MSHLGTVIELGVPSTPPHCLTASIVIEVLVQGF